MWVMLYKPLVIVNATADLLGACCVNAGQHS